MTVQITSDRGVLEICEHEGIVPAPYRDSVGVMTFGVGHTANAGGLDPADLPMVMPHGKAALDAAIDRAIRQLADDIEIFERRVRDHLKVPLKQHEFDALVSFDFNTGGIWYFSARLGRHTHAKLVTTLNRGLPKASENFFGWLKPPELRKRRTAEKNLFDTGSYDANGDTIPIWGTDGRGNLTEVIGTMSGAEILERMERAKGGPKRPVARPKTKTKSPADSEGPLAGFLRWLFSLTGGIVK